MPSAGQPPRHSNCETRVPSPAKQSLCQRSLGKPGTVAHTYNPEARKQRQKDVTTPKSHATADELHENSLFSKASGDPMAQAHWCCYPWLVLLCACAWSYPQPGYLGREDVRNCSTNPPHLPVTAANTTIQLAALRQWMQAWNLTAYIVPDTDAHMSEYIGKHDERRAWISGFTGSAGTAVVTMGKAAVWTDSRYWTQADRQMDCNWELKKEVSISSIVTWILAEVPAGGHVGFDPFLLSVDSWENYNLEFQDSNRRLVSVPTNLVDLAWGSDRPPMPSQPIYALPKEFTGSTWQEKVSTVRSYMKNHAMAPTGLLLSALDETAWLFNLRSGDIPYNPFFYSYTLLTDSSIRLFVNKSRFSLETLQYLNTSCSSPMCVQLEDYSQVRDSVKAYASGNVTILIGLSYTTYGLYEVIPKEKLVTQEYSPVMLMKAVKNSREQALLKASHIRELPFFSPTSKMEAEGQELVTMIYSSLYLSAPSMVTGQSWGRWGLERQMENESFSSGPSFETISASGLNAALAHYSPTKDLHRKLSSDEMYLVDSGGQYWDGTTDITRTVHWGTPTAFQKVRKAKVDSLGSIQWSRSNLFSLSGRMVEAFARRALWEVGLNYGHGTGHGIGNFLCVHEWPVGFQSNNIAMAKGMFTSIEPGYYQDGEFGIRLEDVALVVEAKTKHPGAYLTFEVVSFVPYDRNLIDVSLLSPEQLQYLNQYYQTIREKVGPELQRRQLLEEFAWLEQHTQPLSAMAPITTSLTSMWVAFTLAILSWSS
ncbi:xaa-Pro aminopeptidase 2-like protein [Cricetulus griseus]|uniref:Xaa-Pro aminopeptidase 2 n=1 Tax=Cricetulus griseus TaxID=10029 RepID=A0A061HUA8_CRIGR|nr:xaa-Pro aminopeptidase 2-like protein [Cricetulus griseus]